MNQIDENTIRLFFEGHEDVQTLRRKLKSSVSREGKSTTHHVADMTNDFEIRSAHLLAICNAFLNKQLDANDIEDLAFTLIASDHVNWDGDTEDGSLCAEVLWDWSGPEINYPITMTNMQMYKSMLEGGKYNLPKSTGGRPKKNAKPGITSLKKKS